jgi:hypothetical protein
MDSTFIPLYDLFSLTEAQRAAYIQALNEHMRLDPRLNLIRLTKMASDSGDRLVPYIGKGGTDILRDTWEIDVTEMIQHDGPGYVSFTAVGKNKKGRVDRAVGAAATEGLRGTRLADAIATAQTKASRRLTLQFVGAGVLDESEVQSTTQMVELPSSQAQLAGSPTVMPPAPTAAPSAAPGKDITQPVITITLPPTTAEAVDVYKVPAYDNAPHTLITRLDYCEKVLAAECGAVPKAMTHVDEAVTKEPVAGDPDFDMAKNIQDTLTEGAQALKDRPAQSPKEVGVSSVAQNPPKEGVSLQEVASNESCNTGPESLKKRGRPRKKRNTVVIDSPGQQTLKVPETKPFDPKAVSVAAATEYPKSSIDEPAKCLECGEPLNDHEYVYGNGYICKVSPAPPSAAEAAVSSQAKAQPETLAAPQNSEPPATAIREGGASGNGAVIIPPLTESKSSSVDIPPSQQTLTPQTALFVPPQPTPTFGAPPIADEKMKGYRERLKVYANDVLPKQGGMMPSEGYGGVTMKLRTFAQLQVGVGSVAAFTVDQWEMLFEFLDGHLKQFGAKELVAYIDKAIGATK